MFGKYLEEEMCGTWFKGSICVANPKSRMERIGQKQYFKRWRLRIFQN